MRVLRLKHEYCCTFLTPHSLSPPSTHLPTGHVRQNESGRKANSKVLSKSSSRKPVLRAWPSRVELHWAGAETKSSDESLELTLFSDFLPSFGGMLLSSEYSCYH